MIKINTSHIPVDFPLDVDGGESTSILELDPAAQPPLVPGETIRYHLSATMAGADMVVTGTAQFPITTICSRCGEDVQSDIRVPNLCLVFEKVKDLEVDLTDHIREELLLAIPSRFYCKPDCKGICPHCGANLNETSCQCAAAPKEEPAPAGPSPWDSLDALKLEEKPKKTRRRK